MLARATEPHPTVLQATEKLVGCNLTNGKLGGAWERG